MAAMIEVDGLSKRFGGIQAVNDVSFEVQQGEVLGFLGPNGAGKSTTMKMITGFLEPDAGTARLDGIDIRERPIAARKCLGYMPEGAPSYQEMTPLGFLGFIAGIRGLSGKEAEKRIAEAAEKTQLQSVLYQPIDTLSRGFKRRVGLAQALLHDPDILILDEPTSGLDPNQIVEIRELIRRIGREKTIILSTHILPEVQVTCDRVLIINRGELVASGTPEELASRGGGGTGVRLEIRGPQEEIEAELRALEGVTSVEWKAADRPEWHRYILKTSNGGLLTEDVFRLAVEKNWVLSELGKEKASLEEVFAALTAGERA
jgi:ABC-2 type transport system ATP-binding protein